MRTTPMVTPEACQKDLLMPNVRDRPRHRRRPVQEMDVQHRPVVPRGALPRPPLPHAPRGEGVGGGRFVGHRLRILYFCRPIQGVDGNVYPSVALAAPCRRWMAACPSVASTAPSRR